LIAVAAHLSFLIGLPLIAPIALYVIKRAESRFIAFHALQAAIAHALFVALVIVAVVLLVPMTILGAASHSVFGRSPELAVVAGVLALIPLSLVWFALLVVQTIAAYSAWQGGSWSIPFAGAIARGILGADDTVAKD
jgi:uncharacterized membrane protein